MYAIPSTSDVPKNTLILCPTGNIFRMEPRTMVVLPAKQRSSGRSQAASARDKLALSLIRAPAPEESCGVRTAERRRPPVLLWKCRRHVASDDKQVRWLVHVARVTDFIQRDHAGAKMRVPIVQAASANSYPGVWDASAAACGLSCGVRSVLLCCFHTRRGRGMNARKEDRVWTPTKSDNPCGPLIPHHAAATIACGRGLVGVCHRRESRLRPVLHVTNVRVLPLDRCIYASSG